MTDILPNMSPTPSSNPPFKLRSMVGRLQKLLNPDLNLHQHPWICPCTEPLQCCKNVSLSMMGRLKICPRVGLQQSFWASSHANVRTSRRHFRKLHPSP